MNAFITVAIRTLAIMLTCIPLSHANNETAALSELNKLLTSISSLQAEFVQTTKVKTTRIPIKAGQTLRSSQLGQNFSGIMQVKRPNNFRWEVQKPMNQLITSNGQQVWIYDPDLMQATQQALDAQINNTPALLLSGNITQIAQSFNVSKPDPNNGDFVLKPRSGDGVFEKLTIRFQRNLPQRMVLLDALGQETTIIFSNIKLNPTMSNSQFKFTPPAGVDVINQ